MLKLRDFIIENCKKEQNHLLDAEFYILYKDYLIYFDDFLNDGMAEEDIDFKLDVPPSMRKEYDKWFIDMIIRTKHIIINDFDN
jgi:hypothetical protein